MVLKHIFTTKNKLFFLSMLLTSVQPFTFFTSFKQILANSFPPQLFFSVAALFPGEYIPANFSALGKKNIDNYVKEPIKYLQSSTLSPKILVLLLLADKYLIHCS